MPRPASRVTRSRRSPRRTPTRTAASSSPTPTACSPTTTGAHARSWCQCVATGDTGMQTGYEAPGRTMGFELFDSVLPEQVGRTAATRALSLLDAVPAPTGRIPVVLRKGAGGVLFHEACGHGLEADHIYKDASVFARRAGRARRVAARHARRRRHLRPRVGDARDRRRRPPRATQRADRERRAHRLHVGPPARRARRVTPSSGNGRRETLPPSADAAHDQHVRARRRDRSRRHRAAASSSASTACSSAAVR